MRNRRKSWEADFPIREEVEDHAGRIELQTVDGLEMTHHRQRGPPFRSRLLLYLRGRLDVSVGGGQTRAEVTGFCEKADGTKIIVANASALESR